MAGAALAREAKAATEKMVIFISIDNVQSNKPSGNVKLELKGASKGVQSDQSRW